MPRWRSLIKRLVFPEYSSEATISDGQCDCSPRFDAVLEQPRDRNVVIICLFVFFTQFQPSEPFLVDYLLDDVGLGAYQVYGEVLNLYIYARLPCVMLVGLLSEAPGCSSRLLLIVGAAC